MSFAYVPDSTEYGMVGTKFPPAIILHGGKVLSPGASPRRPMLNNVWYGWNKFPPAVILNGGNGPFAWCEPALSHVC